jgi:hypothetical protein
MKIYNNCQDYRTARLYRRGLPRLLANIPAIDYVQCDAETRQAASVQPRYANIFTLLLFVANAGL